MANVLGTSSVSYIMMKALDLVFTMRPILQHISFDVSDEQCDFNQSIISRTIGIPAVNNFGTGAVDTADVDVSVTLNQFKETHIALTPQEYSGTKRNLLDERAKAIAIAISNSMTDALASLWIAGNFTNSTIVASGWNYTNTIIALRNALVGRGVPQGQQKFLACNSAVYGALLTDQLVVSQFNNPMNNNAIATGQLPMVSGVMVDEYPSIPTTGNMVGFAGTPDSAVIAMRTPKDVTQLFPGLPLPGTIETYKHPINGMPLMLNLWLDMATMKLNMRVIWMYGIAKGNANNGQILKTA